MNLAEAKIHSMGKLFDTESFSKSVSYTPYGGVLVPNVIANIIYGYSDNNYGLKSDDYTWVLTAERDFRSTGAEGSTKNVAVIVVQVSVITNPQYQDIIKEPNGTIWTITEVFDREN